jgi:hypothetical protein
MHVNQGVKGLWEHAWVFVALDELGGWAVQHVRVHGQADIAQTRQLNTTAVEHIPRQPF